jgi:hypothetical protein
MADQPELTITITLTPPVRVELARLARDRHASEGELIRGAVEGLVRSERRPGIPRYARRLGPIAPAEESPPTA